MKQKYPTSLLLGIPRDFFLGQTEVVVLLPLPGPTYCSTLLLNPHSVLNIILLNCFKQHYRWKKDLSTFSVSTDLHLIAKINLPISCLLNNCLHSWNTAIPLQVICWSWAISTFILIPTDQHMSKILDLLKIFNLAQSVNLPTHTHWHILDWIIYRPDDKILVSSSV